MKKKKYILLTLILSLLSIDSVYAGCSEESKKEYEQIRHQYKVTTTFDSNSKKYTVRIEKANTDKFAYTTSITAEYDCKIMSDTVTECYGIEPGKSFYVYTMGKTNDCDIMLNEEEITLKKYNQYYGDPLCTGIEEFVLCQELYDREIDRETFESRINKYKKSMENKKQQEEKEEELKKQQEEKILNKVVSYVRTNQIQVIIIIIFIILATITAIIEIKSSKKSRRLE